VKTQASNGTGPAPGGSNGEPMAFVDGGADWALRALEAQEPHCHGFLDSARKLIPASVLRMGDPISRKWMVKSAHPYLDEIDRLAARVGREGVYTLNLAYEWACLGGVGTNQDTGNVRFLRVLDYQFRGVGRHLVAVKAESEAGPWLNVTWPGRCSPRRQLRGRRFSCWRVSIHTRAASLSARRTRRASMRAPPTRAISG
jgi:hypothetical protein